MIFASSLYFTLYIDIDIYSTLVKQSLPCFIVRAAYTCLLTLSDLVINSISSNIVLILKLCSFSNLSLVKTASSYKGS